MLENLGFGNKNYMGEADNRCPYNVRIIGVSNQYEQYKLNILNFTKSRFPMTFC